MGSKVSSRVTMNTSILQVLDKAQIDALCLTADETMTELKNSGVMPFDTGDMQNSQTEVDESRKRSGVVSVVTSAPQARRLYYHPEYNFNRKNNRSAGGKWFERFDTSRIPEIYVQMFQMLGRL